ncbi:MAG: murein hydrolase activator EnvC family protein [Armatimonadota bacterium]
MKLSRTAIAVILLVGIIIQPVAARKSLSELQREMREAAQRMRSVQAKLHEVKKQQATAATELAYSEKRLRFTQISLSDIRSQLSDTRGRLSVTKQELAVIQKRLDERNKLLEGRLVDTYKHGNVSYLSVVLGAEDLSDLLSRGYVVRKIFESDMELVEGIKEDKRAVEEHKAALESQERKRSGLEREQAQLTRDAYSQKVNRARIVRAINSDRAKYEQMLAELDQNSRQISALIRSRESTPAGRKSAEQKWTGSFIRPVSGRITSGFGMRYHPILHERRMHTGVDLASPAGTPIKAAASGEVIYSGWFGAYGNAVIIDHGGGVTTLYGHQSSISVHTGQSVKQGQVIGKVGSTGWSTGPHLHFEVRKHGTPVSPF